MSTRKPSPLSDWLEKHEQSNRAEVEAARRTWANAGKGVKESLCKRARVGEALADFPLAKLSTADLQSIDAATGRLMDDLRRLGKAFQVEFEVRAKLR